MYTEETAAYFASLQEELVQLIEALCAHPAPSGQEEQRSGFCLEWLHSNGAESAYIDSAKNVLYPYGCKGKDKIILFCAHTDTVFPDTQPMPFHNDGTYLHSPGVGDDTACVAMLLMVARFVTQRRLTSDYGILFAANSCEEGLGNLRGIKQIMADYGHRITEVYAFDATFNHIFDRCVGSERYRITLRTQGGHSYYDFGNSNAIAAAAELITKLYRVEVPRKDGSKTTYNVGTVSGGCSVNTVAQEASFLYEYRSDDYSSLATMRQTFHSIVEAFRARGLAQVTVETVGIRPCANLSDSARLREMADRAVQIVQKHTGKDCGTDAASTDCNVPLSMGIPAVCIGTYWGEGAHTREEKIRIDSLAPGLAIVAETVLDFCGEKA